MLKKGKKEILKTSTTGTAELKKTCISQAKTTFQENRPIAKSEQKST
jgi:hypothetical protein